MASPTRGMCSECLRSFSAGSGSPSAGDCPYCGGLAGASGAPADGARTPVSLELTPEDVGASWVLGSERTEDEGPGGSVGRFQVRELLGGGGFGRVYRAYDPRLDREVALKVLKPSRTGPKSLERFFREARAAAQLDHPNIVALHDAGRDDGRCWIAYQYVAGPSLARWRDAHAIDCEAAVRLVRALADALDHAHRRGVCHRDVKPANVMVDGSGRPRLTDFGLARRLDADSSLTVEGAVIGTPAYMSPEQAAGFACRADARSDLYSLGVTFHELLTGRRPHDLPSGVPAWRALGSTAGHSAPAIDPALPRGLAAICRRTLAVDPGLRYPDARAFARDLDRWLASKGRGRRRFLGPGPVLAGLAVALLAADIGLRLAPHSSPPAEAVRALPAVSAIPQTGGPAPADLFLGNRAKRVLHRPSCPSIRSASPQNLVGFAEAGRAVGQGYKGCKLCDPLAMADDVPG